MIFRHKTACGLDWIEISVHSSGTRLSPASQEPTNGFPTRSTGPLARKPFRTSRCRRLPQLAPSSWGLEKKEKRKSTFPPLRDPPFSYLATTSSSSNYLCSLSSLSRKSLQNKKRLNLFAVDSWRVFMGPMCLISTKEG